MTRSKLNLITDGLMLLCMAAIAGIALLIKFVLVPGYQRWEIYGRNVELYFWGLDRHQWGTIHLLFGLVFIALADEEGIDARRLLLGEHHTRSEVRDRSCKAALNLLRLRLLGGEST